MVRAVNQAGATQAEYLFSTLNLDGSTIAPISTLDSDSNQMNNEINSGFRLMNLNVSSTRYLLLQKLNVVLPILCGIAVLTLAAVIVCSYQSGKLFANNSSNIYVNDANQTGILGNSNCSTSSASTNNTAIGINAANLDSSNCLINELTCGLLADQQQQQSLICPTIAHSQYQPSSNYSDCTMIHAMNCNEHEYKLCSDLPTSNLASLTSLANHHHEFASINKSNMRSTIGNSLFKSAFNRENNNANPAANLFPSPYAFSRLNEYRTPTIETNRLDNSRTLKDNLTTVNLTESADSITTFKLKPISTANDKKSVHNYDTPMFLKRVN